MALDFFQVQRLAAQNKVPPEVIEKDFLIELILFYLSKDKLLKDNLIFRGGTSLRKIYYPDYRYSEDLDFVLEHLEDIRQYEKAFEELLLRINKDYPFQLKQHAEYHDGRWQAFVNYDIISEIRGNKELKIDVCLEQIIPDFRKREILFSYPGFEKAESSIYTYDLESIISEKVGRILDVVNEARDIYDLWYLLKKKLSISRIKAAFKKKYGYGISVSSLTNAIKKEEYRRNWIVRLKNQIPNLLSFDTVVSELTEDIKKLS